MTDGSAGRVLIVDDLKGVRQVLASILEKAGYAFAEAEDGQSALDLAATEAFDAILLDIRMPGLSGFDVLTRLLTAGNDTPVIMVTAYDDVDTAVKAMHLGAYHYLSKPFRGDEVVAVVARAIEHHRLSAQLRSLQERLDRAAIVPALLGTSLAIRRLAEQVDRVAATDLAVLLIGEHGAGKEQVARSIHARSPRCHGPFVAVDCGAFPAELAERELFGYEPGAFPGADRARPGHLELAAGGTAYLADVGALPLTAQGRLVRFLQEGHVQRLGATGRIPLETRLITASAIDLRELVAGHLFRHDLYIRLAECTLAIPPLREHTEDLIYLVKHFLDETNHELGKAVKGPTPEALDLLMAHPWPGDLRELRQVIQRAVLLATDRVEPAHQAIAAPPAPPPPGTPPRHDERPLPLPELTRRAVERLERETIRDALRRTGGNKSAAARILGIDYKTLHLKVKKYRLRETEEPMHVSRHGPRSH